MVNYEKHILMESESVRGRIKGCVNSCTGYTIPPRKTGEGSKNKEKQAELKSLLGDSLQLRKIYKIHVLFYSRISLFYLGGSVSYYGRKVCTILCAVVKCVQFYYLLCTTSTSV